jgi:hypothetical protein
VVLYGCETWSLILREEHRLRVFENRALRRIFGPKRDEVTGGWRKLNEEEFHNLYSLPNIIRIIKSRTMRWAGHVARMEEPRNLVNTVINFRVPYYAGKFLSGCTIGSFSRAQLCKYTALYLSR